ncbi:MAG: hypothetical protein ABIH26_14070 [Candidatus Eisenbacteria bacterium]
MRRSLWSRFRPWIVVVAGVVFVFSFAAAEQFVGMDVNGDVDCESQPGDFDMGRTFGAGEVGTQKTFTIFYDDTPNLYGFGCVFCVQEKAKVGTASWVYAAGLVSGGWNLTQLRHSDEGGFPITPSTLITGTYPNYRCYLVSGYDFNFTTPITTFPYVVGTFTFDVAAEGPIYWVFDVGDGNTQGQTTGFYTISFLGPGQACPPPAATESASWGSVKQLFR